MKKESEEDIFLGFLIKEKENAYINKIYAQTAIRYMGKCFEERVKNETLSQKIFQHIRDFFMEFYLYFVFYKNKQKTKNLTDKDKKEKILNHKQFKHGNFKIHFYLIRRFQTKTLVDDSGCVDISNFEFDASIRIEYSEIITQHHLKKTFNNEDDATNYFNQLLLDNKKKNGILLINELSNKMDEEFHNLKKQTVLLESKLLNEEIKC